jgi:glycosyltransferase involved in cell wall biosynthesis
LKVSVVVPAFNEERVLAGSLESIRAATRVFEGRGWSIEVIVCDNNSTDRTAEIAAAAGAIVVFEPINQISRARNAGAARASGDWLLFVDADSQPSRELFEDVAREIERGRCIAGGSTVRFNPAELHGQAARRARAGAALWNITSRLTRWGAGSFIFCSREAFQAVGGFSEEWFAGEEIDLFRRFKRLARARGRSITILHRHPLLTSGRKLHLYQRREMLFFMLKTLMSGGRNLRKAEDCFAWYDGRR